MSIIKEGVMKKNIFQILMLISVFVGTLLLHTYVTPRKARPIISLILLAIVIGIRIYEKKFSKIHAIILGVGFILILGIMLQRYL